MEKSAAYWEGYSSALEKCGVSTGLARKVLQNMAIRLRTKPTADAAWDTLINRMYKSPRTVELASAGPAYNTSPFWAMLGKTKSPVSMAATLRHELATLANAY